MSETNIASKLYTVKFFKASSLEEKQYVESTIESKRKYTME